MKLLFAIFVLINTLFGTEVVEVDKMFQQSKSCKTCHVYIVKEWEKSWHAKSHYNSDAYLKATMDYVSRKTRKSLNSVKVQCATCHNPRISVTSTNMDYEIDAVMGLDIGSEVNKAVQNDAINEGINCVVCHNIDKIHSDIDESKRGINRVEWMKSGVMSGPYNDSKSPYHKVEHRDFMDKKSNNLCFVCHANDRSVSGLVFTDMKSEFKSGKKDCIDCHMGAKKIGVASTYRTKGKQKKRMIRSHGFEGAHVEDMWKGALNLSLLQKGKNLEIKIQNPQPHNIPSGFGARELILDISYKNQNKELKSSTVSLTRHYTSKRKKPTIPHLAVKSTKDMSIPALGKKVIRVPVLDGASSVKVRLSYRLVNDEVRSILKLKGDTWSKKYFITSESIKL